MTAGYSGTPLVRKLGIKAGMRCAVLNPPSNYWELLPGLPDDLTIIDDSDASADFIHLFVREREGLSDRLRRLRGSIAPDGMVWVSWPKRAAKIPTDLKEDVIREDALAAGLVDVKVCAVDDVWSGLKLVIRRSDRH